MTSIDLDRDRPCTQRVINDVATVTQLSLAPVAVARCMINR